RVAARAVEKTRAGKKEKAAFLNLIQEGREKAYEPPIPDSRPYILYKPEPSYSESARRERVSGWIEVAAEFRADGFIGAVTVIKGLEDVLEKKGCKAARNFFFSPAVRNQKFALQSLRVMYSFNIY